MNNNSQLKSMLLFLHVDNHTGENRETMKLDFFELWIRPSIHSVTIVERIDVKEERVNECALFGLFASKKDFY